ncbi:MAG: MarR family transcriptional regulator [Butyricicoccus sp.]|nr:MarR family transcriptional regulator [Butyricicoccus sp.]
MPRQTVTILKHISVIQRNTQRYFDSMLEQRGIGSGQQFFLLRIFENPDITMFDLSKSGSFDKGTVSKAVQKLAEEGYVKVTVDTSDKRVRHLRVTEYAKPVIEEIYALRTQWVDQLMTDLSPEERDTLFQTLQTIAEYSCAGLQELCQPKEKSHEN